MTARWLTPDDTATYIGVRVHELPRLVREGKVPAPSRHLGPRRPRYDREALDKAFGTDARSADSNREALNAAVQQILAAGRTRKPQAARGRVNQGISVSAQSAPVITLRSR